MSEPASAANANVSACGPARGAPLLLLGALSAMAPLAIDIALPGFAAIERDLTLPAGSGAATLSTFLIGFASGPLVFGALSDRIGRRPLLLLGLLLFTLAGLACMLAASLPLLLAARLVQGIGAGAAAAMPIAIVRDAYDGIAARRALSTITLVGSVAPVLAPTFGALMMLIAGWRSIFALLVGAGAILLAATARGFAETLMRERRARSGMRHVLRDYGVVVSDRQFVRFAFVNACNFATMFAYVAASPLVFLSVLHVGQVGFALIFATTALGIVAGAAINSRLLARGADPARLLVIALWINVASGGTLLIVALGGFASVPTMLPLLILGNMCAGVVRPNATHEAMQPMAHIAGSASAVLRGTQMLAGAAISATIALLPHGAAAMTMAGAMTACAALAVAGTIGMSAAAAPVR